MTNIEDFVIQKVKAMRMERKWSQVELADYMNLSPSFIADIENPKRRAKYNLNHLNELAKVFSCSPKDFLPTISGSAAVGIQMTLPPNVPLTLHEAPSLGRGCPPGWG